MPVEIQTYPDEPDSVQTVTLGGTQYRVTFTWRDRTASWYADIATVDGTAIALGRRLSPGLTLLYGLQPTGWDGGDVYVFGPDPYQRGDLGAAVRLWYYTAAELDAITTPGASDVRVSL